LITVVTELIIILATCELIVCWFCSCYFGRINFGINIFLK